jgi:hypothetical protein
MIDENLSELLRQLTPRERKIIADALKEGSTLTQDVREILRWLRRRLKRRARSKRR